ncbi:MAG TPA: phage holin family protein [Tessaracoccus flavescens]|uniref:Phage holin family protein n=1 Tax=Tessaracoccus flavescens TaxID=399497 RepID=A0A921JR06_9ACTN|nr:phage holin family protein [Tessaracoccus flavescens]
MSKFVWRLIVTVLAVAVAVWLVPGITLGTADLTEQALTLLGVALIIGVVNAFVKPFAQALGTCLIVLTLGLFLLVINALMLLLTSWISAQVGLSFHVDGFWAAFWGALVIAVIGAILGGVLGTKRD